MKCWNEKESESKVFYKVKKRKHMLQYTLAEQISHGMEVSNLAYDVGKKLGYGEEVCYDLAIAGLLHDIGKIVLANEVSSNPMIVEEMKVVRMHPKEGYEVVKRSGYSHFIQECVLYHHENYDGSGYPDHLFGDEIPFGGRVLRVCDVFCALTSDRPYRKAYDQDTAIKLMVEDIRDFDVKVFLAFQKVIHEKNRRPVELGEFTVDERGDLEWH